MAEESLAKDGCFFWFAVLVIIALYWSLFLLNDINKKLPEPPAKTEQKQEQSK